MCLDAAGIYFNCCAFNGWYMSTEIGRDLLESNRYNKLEVIYQTIINKIISKTYIIN